jgi:hypothetical protein
MPEEEIYDLQLDPWQIKNLAQSDLPEHQAALKKLRVVLENWIVETHDQGVEMESLEQLKAAERRFDPDLDWRPRP